MIEGCFLVSREQSAWPQQHDETNSMTSRQNNTDSQLQHQALLQVIEQLIDELHSHRLNRVQVSLDSSLDRDLGLDSLARMELLTRIEQRFGIQLSEQLLASAETPRDLLRTLERSSAVKEQDTSIKLQATQQSDQKSKVPQQAETLNEVILFHTANHPDRTHIIFEPTEDTVEQLTYKELFDGAVQIARGLQHHGLQQGECAAIMLPTGLDYFFSFFGILLAGGIPVPLYPPVRPTQIEEHMRRHAKILTNARAKILITIPEVKPVAQLLKAQTRHLNHVLENSELTAHHESFDKVAVEPDDTAFLQYTSGSTGDPKGVVLTHRNLLANIRAMGETVQVTSDDVFVSWLPLYHDMGLIGAWLGSLYYGCRLVIMPPLTFLARPQRWLWAIHNHRGSLSASPNFGYELCCKRISDKLLEGLDLSSWRMAFNGAEPISPETLINFEERFRSYGLKQTSLAPVYGLAESSVGLAFPPPDRPFLIDRIHRDTFTRSGKSTPFDGEHRDMLEFVACGQPLPGHQIRIVDDSDRELPDRMEGHIQFKGPSTTSGYYRNPKQNKYLFHDDWLDSGDLGYMDNGELYVTGRKKDIIIRGGRNIYPHEIEGAIGNINKVRKGCVVAFGSHDHQSATERLVIIAETRARKQEAIDQLKQTISETVLDLTGMVPDEIVLAKPGNVLKTSSGKIRRAANKEMFEQERIGKPTRAVWLQITRMAAKTIIPQTRRLLNRTTAGLYACYCWLLFGIIGAVTALVVAVLPSKKGRWWFCRLGCRLLAFLSGTTIRTTGLEHLDTETVAILASNHMSYIDSIVLWAVLPKQCSFIGKEELGDKPFLKYLLSRIDVVLVNRFDFEKGIEDIDTISGLVASGAFPLFFCEGTFQRMPGLLPFQLGAFTIAARCNVPIIPITIRGTRNKLRSGTWYPRTGGVWVTFSKPLAPTGDSWSDALDLRDRTRSEILGHLREPDLAKTITSITQTEAGEKIREKKP